MEIKSKFYIGQPVYMISLVFGPMKCPICDGECTVEIKKHIFDCPGCNGDGEVHDVTNRVWKIKGCEDLKDDSYIEEMREYAKTITIIRIDTTTELDEHGKPTTLVSYGYDLLGEDGCLDTGFLDENDCFATLDEAIEGCRKRNKEEQK